MQLYIMSVSNPGEVVNGARPQVVEHGPYVYRETRRKENILNVEVDKLHYGAYMDYTFDQVKTLTIEISVIILRAVLKKGAEQKL
jgi:hypothetical protein